MTTPAIRAALERLLTMASDELTTPGLWARCRKNSRVTWNSAITAGKAALEAAQPEGEVVGLTDEELLSIASDCKALYVAHDVDDDNYSEVLAAMRAAIAADRATPPAPQEGEPPSWCETDAEQRAWQAGWEARDDVMLRPATPPAPLEGEVGELVRWLRRLAAASWIADVTHDKLLAVATLLEQLSTAHPERLHRCPTHGQQPANAWGCPECVRELRQQLSAAAPAVVPVAIPGEQWHEDDGACLWWRFPIEEPPWAGDPRDDDWPGYHTHFTRIVCPVLPAPQGGEVG